MGPRSGSWSRGGIYTATVRAVVQGDIVED
jgi:hypothetical protein